MRSGSRQAGSDGVTEGAVECAAMVAMTRWNTMAAAWA